MRLIIVLLLCSACHATEYCFAPNSPASFRTMVRKVIAVRAQCEDWTEVPPVPFWQPAPLTFQAVTTAFITPLPAGGHVSFPLTEGEIYRYGNIAAWIFRSGAPRDFIFINVRNRTKRDVMMQDVNAEIELWLKGKQ